MNPYPVRPQDQVRFSYYVPNPAAYQPAIRAQYTFVMYNLTLTRFVRQAFRDAQDSS